MKKEKKTYQVIEKRKLTEKLCGHMKRKRKVMSDDELAALAAGYDDL